jgi:hypothetical protein
LFSHQFFTLSANWLMLLLFFVVLFDLHWQFPDNGHLPPHNLEHLVENITYSAVLRPICLSIKLLKVAHSKSFSTSHISTDMVIIRYLKLSLMELQCVCFHSSSSLYVVPSICASAFRRDRSFFHCVSLIRTILCRIALSVAFEGVTSFVLI